MNFNWDMLRPEEQINLCLRGLYENCGYKRFRMNKFEEYAFYMRNKNFLQSQQVITFTDTDGKLMALKPDITLSIIKNTRALGSGKERIYYTESVYRVPRNADEFREIEQTGVELIGNIDTYSKTEIISLAADSLAVIDNSFMLDVSHMGYIEGALEYSGVDYSARKKLLACLDGKNPHDIIAIAEAEGLNGAARALLSELATLGGPFKDILPRVSALCQNDAMRAAVEELSVLWESVKAQPFADKMRLDLSIVSDTDYYNGLLFRGYVKNVPAAVLVGGQYDKLLHRMGKSDLGAIGFAVSFDELDRYLKNPAPAPYDTLVLYSESSDPALVESAVRSRLQAGERVLAYCGYPDGLQYKNVVTIDGQSVKEGAGNA